jgi:hypothetical protein
MEAEGQGGFFNHFISAGRNILKLRLAPSKHFPCERKTWDAQLTPRICKKGSNVLFFL